MKKIFPKPFIFSLILFVPLVMSTTVFCEETYVFVLKWGELGSGDGQFQYPGGIDLDINGIVYVTDLFNHRIQKFDSKGNFLAKWGSYGSGDGQFKYPQGIAIDFIGNVCVADHGNHRVQKFDTDGHFLVKWGSFGSADGQFLYTMGIAVDGDGCVYVTDDRNHRVQKFALHPIEQLIDNVEDLVNSIMLNQGEANALITKLDNALKSLEKENIQPACNQLGAFINQVNALINSGKLAPELGQELIDAAQRIMDKLCR